MRRVEIPILKGGRVRLHYFHRTDEGPVQTTSGVLAMTPAGPVPGGARGRIACMPARQSVFSERGADGVVRMFPHTDDPRAATCPECLKTQDYKEQMAALGEPQLETAG